MKKYLFIFIILSFFLTITEASAGRLSGYILLQVEANGEAWYVNPADDIRYYLGRPADAFKLMKVLGVGIKNEDLKKIPIAFTGNTAEKDYDSDGLSHDLEISLGTDPYRSDSDKDGFGDGEELKRGYDPMGPGYLPTDKNFAKKHSGKIFLQVEKNGEAWYVSPADGKRYFLGNPTDAFALMRSLGLGIKNSDLDKIEKEHSESMDRKIEMYAHSLINLEREKIGLPALLWNDDLARVAREHSENLADENKSFTGQKKACDLPIIHHEGVNFGLHNSERLNNREIYYFSSTGENIALMPSAHYKIRYMAGDPIEKELASCEIKQEAWDREFKDALSKEESESKKIEIIKAEIARRIEAYKTSSDLFLTEKEAYSDEKVIQNTVTGWMNSAGHKKNILDAEYDEAGIGLAWVGDYLIITQVFIKRADCGYANGPCCERNGCYLPMSCDASSQLCLGKNF